MDGQRSDQAGVTQTQWQKRGIQVLTVEVVLLS